MKKFFSEIGFILKDILCLVGAVTVAVFLFACFHGPETDKVDMTRPKTNIMLNEPDTGIRYMYPNMTIQELQNLVLKEDQYRYCNEWGWRSSTICVNLATNLGVAVMVDKIMIFPIGKDTTRSK